MFYIVKYELLGGFLYILLLKMFVEKKVIVNMKNYDDECFKWCIIRV